MIKRTTLALFAWFAAFTLHNLEEVALSFPVWLAQHTQLPFQWQSPAFLLAVAVLELLALVAVTLAAKNRWAKWLALIMVAGTLVNVFTHMALSVAANSYSPGLATAVLLLLPASLWAWYELKQLKV